MSDSKERYLGYPFFKYPFQTADAEVAELTRMSRLSCEALPLLPNTDKMETIEQWRAMQS